MSSPVFATRVLEGFKDVLKEIGEQGGEFDFRYSLATCLLQKALNWKRKEGEGHFRIEQERKDIVLFDELKFPVGVIETKKPSETLTKDHEIQLEEYRGQGSARPCVW